MRSTQEGESKAYAPGLLHRNAPGKLPGTQLVFYVNYQKMTVLTNASSAEESAWGAASLELSGPPTAPLLGQLEHLAALA